MVTLSDYSGSQRDLWDIDGIEAMYGINCYENRHQRIESDILRLI